MRDSGDSLIRAVPGDFAAVFPGRSPAFISRASGRVELIGGHTDYNEGFVIAAAIDKSCQVAASVREDNRICLYSEWAKEKHQFELSRDVEPSEACRWANYARGVAALLLKEGVPLAGGNLYITSEVPVGAGLSSSAALEVSLARAMIHLSACRHPALRKPNQVEPLRLAQICQKAENIYANSPCGIMDQIVSLTGRKDHAILLDCRDLSVKFLPFHCGSACIMIFDSMVKHEVGAGQYGKRRQQCEQAAAVLSKRFPQVKALRDADKSALKLLKDQMDSVVFSRASHVIGENHRVLAAAEALTHGRVRQFGSLMSESHRSARDLYQISCEQTDFLAEEICRHQAAYGARISGAGFGGSVVALVRPEAASVISQKVGRAYKRRFGLDCGIYLVSPSQGTEIIQLPDSS